MGEIGPKERHQTLLVNVQRWVSRRDVGCCCTQISRVARCACLQESSREGSAGSVAPLCEAADDSFGARLVVKVCTAFHDGFQQPGQTRGLVHLARLPDATLP